MTIEPDGAEVARILDALGRGEEGAADALLPLVYDELRRLAAGRLRGEAPGQTLQATALVHEAYLRLVGGGDMRSWEGQGHFLAAAAEAMRRVLVNRARDKRRLKRGGGRRRVDLDLGAVVDEGRDDAVIALDEALGQLEAVDPEAARLVKLRFFAGLGQGEAAAALGMPRRTADRSWAYARAWLYERLRDEESRDSP